MCIYMKAVHRENNIQKNSVRNIILTVLHGIKAPTSNWNWNDTRIIFFFTMGDQTPTSLPQSVIVHHDNSTFPTSIVLDETNFSLWSQLMERAIGARNKIGFLIGEKVKPTTNDLSYGTWITDNNRPKSYNQLIAWDYLHDSISYVSLCFH